MKNGPFSRLFHRTVASILDFLLANQGMDYSISDIAKGTGISYRTAIRDVQKLHTLELIYKTRAVGRIKLYKLRMDDNRVDALIRFYDADKKPKTGLDIYE